MTSPHKVYGPEVEEGDGYAAALVNFRFTANTVWTTEQAVKVMQSE